MKKLGLLAVGCVLFGCFGVVHSGWAQCNTPITLTFTSLQKPEHDEFLYENENQYDLARQGYINSGNQNSGGGHGYECDRFNSPGCKIDDIITMPTGHVFKGQVIPDETKYQCKVHKFLGDDMWVVVDDGTCATKGFGDVAVGNCVGGTDSCKILNDVACSGYEKSDPNGTEFYGVCLEGPKFMCKAVKCSHGMVADNDGKCAKANSGNDGNGGSNDQPDNPVMPPAKKSCKDSRTTAEGKACCDLAEMEATWDGNGCKCTVGTFAIQNGRGVCVQAPVTPGQPYKCSDELIDKLTTLFVDPNTPAKAKTLISSVLAMCVGENPNEQQITIIITQINQIISNNPVKPDDGNQPDGNNGGGAALIEEQQTAARRVIESAMNGLTTIASNDLKVSKWKDADGNFNTARLASDSIAGVVLGTAGGLITSSVVKKNQIKKGFEDISCTIGGQTVAGWGDDFTVGIK